MGGGILRLRFEHLLIAQGRQFIQQGIHAANNRVNQIVGAANRKANRL